MKKATTVLVCFILVVAIGLLVGMGVVIAHGGVSFMGIESSSFAKLQNRQVYSAKDFSAINISYGSDSITLYPSQNGEVVLEEYASRWDEGSAAHISQTNGQLCIEQGERPFVFFGIYISYVHLYVPASWMGDLSLETRSGSIEAANNFNFSSFMANASSGSVKCAQINAEKDIRITSKSGTVRCDTLSADGQITLQASSGSVHFETLTAKEGIEASTNSGSIKGTSATAGKDASFSATSGGIHIDNLTGQSISATSSSGSLRFGAVAADSFKAKATSGGVSVEKITGEFNLESSSGSIEVEGGSGFGKMRSSSGSVRLTLSEVTGDLQLSSSSGGVRLTLPQGIPMEFFAKTGSGSIHTPFDDVLHYNKSGNEASGTYGEGPTYYNVRCETSSGSVKVEWY